MSEKGKDKRVAPYRTLLGINSQVVGQAKKFSAKIASKVKRGPRKVLVANALIELPVPTGTIAALAMIDPSDEFKVETSG